MNKVFPRIFKIRNSLNNSVNLVLALGSRDEIKDQIFIERFGHRCGPSSVIYFRSIKNIEPIVFLFFLLFKSM